MSGTRFARCLAYFIAGEVAASSPAGRRPFPRLRVGDLSGSALGPRKAARKHAGESAMGARGLLEKDGLAVAPKSSIDARADFSDA